MGFRETNVSKPLPNSFNNKDYDNNPYLKIINRQTKCYKHTTKMCLENVTKTSLGPSSKHKKIQ